MSCIEQAQRSWNPKNSTMSFPKYVGFIETSTAINVVCAFETFCSTLHTGRGSPAQCTNRGHTKRRRDDGTDDRTVVQQSDGDGTVIRRDTDRTTGQCCSVHSIRGIRPILRCPLCLQNDAVACLVVEYHTEVRCSKRVR